MNNRRIFEFIQINNNIRVSAVDPVTLKEVIMIFPTGLSQDKMMQAANKKLDYVLKQQNEGNDEYDYKKNDGYDNIV